jgi:hypothetical protein
MWRNRNRILAWLLAGIAIASSVVLVVLWATHLSGPPTLFDAAEALGWGLALPLVFSILAALIIARQPRNRVGWLMMIVALALSSPLDQLFQQQFQAPPETVSLGLWLLIWLSGWSWIPVIFPIFLIPLYFPTGDLPSPRWKWVPRLALGLWLLFMFLSAFISKGGPTNADWTIANPVGGFLPEEFFGGPFLILWGIGLLTVLGASVVSLFSRYRRATSAEGQQIRWLLFAGVFFLLFYAISFFAPDQWIERGWQNLIFVLSILGMPAAIAIAIFRYRLWDLDVVINRAVIYGLLTTLLAGIFASVIAVITELGKNLWGEGSRAAGAGVSALVVAIVFQPLRAWVEAKVNARFYPQKIDLASGLVEVQPEYWGFLQLDTLIRFSMDHVCRVLGTKRAAFYLASGPGEFRLEQQVDDSAAGVTSITLSDKSRQDLEKKRVSVAEGVEALVGHVPVYVDRGQANEVLGLLSIGARENGRGYSGDDLRALAELGGKIGLALNALRLGTGRRPVGG